MPDSIYHYEPELDPEIIEGRLLVNAYLYAHVNHRWYVPTTPQHMLQYLGVRTGQQNWRTNVGTRVVDKGLRWMAQNGFINFDDGVAPSILEHKYRDAIVIYVNESLFDMYCVQIKRAQPYIRLYQSDIEKIFSLKKVKTYKLFRIYCYLRSCMRNAPPFGWVVTHKEIENATGYDRTYISRATQILCDELGVLHRQQLRRIGANVPPYCYIFNIDGWEKYLQQSINQLYGGKNSSAKVSDKKKAENGEKPAEEKKRKVFDDGSQEVMPDDLPPDIRKAFYGY